MTEEGETNALMGETPSHLNRPPSSASSHVSSLQPSSTTKPASKHVLQVIILISSVLLISDLAGYAAYAPQLDIYESIICKQYYAGLGKEAGNVDRPDCKVSAVQSELVLIMAWSDTFPQIPGIVLAIPYGALADHIGRKPVLLLGMLGCILSEVWIRLVCFLAPTIPLRAVWLSAFTAFLGGGPQTVWSLLWVMIADICSAERRTTAFSQLEAAVLIPEIIAIPISAGLMTKSSWLPFMISFVLYLVGFVIACCLPETLPEKLRTEPPIVDETTPLVRDDIEAETSGQSVRKRFLGEVLKLQESMRALRRNGNVLLVLSCFVITCLGKQAIPLILQYAPKRFHWTIAKTSYLMSLRGSITLVLLFVLLPAISEVLSGKMKIYAAMKDKWITQGSMALCLIGSTLIFLAASPPVFIVGFVIRALGASFQITARSLITSMVSQNLVGTVYTAIAAVTSVGMLIAGPLMAYAFRWGMQLDQFWLGMPFLVAAGLYGVGLILISFTKLGH